VANYHLIQNATLILEGHSLNGTSIDILLEDGLIQKIGTNIKSDATPITGANLWVTAGWVDMRCHLTDPGLEHKDTVESLLNTAVAGGFTHVVTLPHSVPTIHDKSKVNYLLQASKGHLASLLPSGVLSDNNQSENLAELYDMHNAGAVAFTNGDKAVSNGLLKKALLYTKPFGAKIITHPSDKSLEQGGSVNESETTIHTGLKTSSSLAEYVNVREQIEVARYCDSPIHFSCISTKESVELIRQAKKEGVTVTCDVSIFNLCFTDKEVLGFDENFKLYPPLRNEDDRKALVAGVNDGTVDAICSNHNPQNVESKQVEFDYADNGALSLQLLLPWYTKYLSKEIDKDTFIAALTTKPRAILGLENSAFNQGEVANITVIDMENSWMFDGDTNQSLSKNSHEWGQEQQGKVKAVFHQFKFNLF
jgi:dihydroorotase